MLDVVTVDTDVLRFDHWAFLTRKVAKKAPTTEVAGTVLPSPPVDADKQKDPEVSDTSRIVTESSQVVVPTFTSIDPIIPVDGANLVGNPAATTIDLSTMAADPNAATIDPTQLADSNVIDSIAAFNNSVVESANLTICTTDGGQGVEVYETSTTEERSDPSLG